MATEKQIEANRKNALKSTGPKTAEGKDRSRRNALKHGMSCQSDILPPEDLELYKDRLHGWTCDWRPEGQIEQYLLACAVLASVRLDRCARLEVAAVARRRRDTIARWQQKQARRVRTWVRRLLDDSLPDDRRAGALSCLRGSAAGCQWLLARWEELGQRLDEAGSWSADEAALAVRLASDLDDEDQGTSGELTALVDAIAQADNGPPDPALVERLAAQIEANCDALVEAAERAWEQSDGPELAEVIDLAGFDDSRRGLLAQRYGRTSTLDMHRALGQLERLRKQRDRDRKDGGRFTGAHPPEPSLDHPASVPAMPRPHAPIEANSEVDRHEPIGQPATEPNAVREREITTSVAYREPSGWPPAPSRPAGPAHDTRRPPWPRDPSEPGQEPIAGRPAASP